MLINPVYTKWNNFLQKENSVDSIMTGVIPVLKKFLLIDDLSLKIIQRGMAPEGGGKVTFFCPARKSLKSIQVYFP